MPKRCPDCQTRTSTPGRCPQCRAEHLATTAGHVDDSDPICAGCGQHAPEGAYSNERRGMWFCPSCSGLELTRAERKQLAAESVPIGNNLDRAVRWAVGDPDAFPESEPVDVEFVSGNDPRLIADGGRPSEEDMLDVELVLGAGRPAEKQVRLDVASGKVVDREDGRLEISLSGGGVDEYLAELGIDGGEE